MPRIRTVKPELAAHEGLFDLEQESGMPMRFAWTMLFTVCDREGRFVWRPRTLKAQILPHDDLDFARVLDAWLTRGFIVKYRVAGEWYGWLPTFTRHQVINNREAASSLPSFEAADEVVDLRNQNLTDACASRDCRDDDACSTREVHARAEGKEGTGKEGTGKEGESVLRTLVDSEPLPASAPGVQQKSGNGLDRDLEQQIIAAYHEELPDLPRVKTWSRTRHSHLSARVRQSKQRGKAADTVDYWRSLFRKVGASDFLMGRKTGFRCPGLAWLIESEERFAKLIEGSYDNSGGNHGRR